MDRIAEAHLAGRQHRRRPDLDLSRCSNSICSRATWTISLMWRSWSSRLEWSYRAIGRESSICLCESEKRLMDTTPQQLFISAAKELRRSSYLVINVPPSHPHPVLHLHSLQPDRQYSCDVLKQPSFGYHVYIWKTSVIGCRIIGLLADQKRSPS